MDPKAIGYSSSYLSNNTENHKKGGERKCAKSKKNAINLKKIKPINIQKIWFVGIPFFWRGIGEEPSRTYQSSRQPRTCWLRMLMRASRMSFVWSEFRAAQAGAGCISSPSSSPPSKMFMCRKKITKMCGSIARQGMWDNGVLTGTSWVCSRTWADYAPRFCSSHCQPSRISSPDSRLYAA